MDGFAQQQEAGTLFLLQLNRLNKAYQVRGEDASKTAAIPAQHWLTLQVTKHWKPFQVLHQTLAVSHRAEQLRRLRRPHRIVATAVDSMLLRTEMGDLETQEENTSKRVLWYRLMAWCGLR